MIQVCSRCGTRWNVRDRQRVWCPRCQGALLAPAATETDQQWGARPGTKAGQAGPSGSTAQLPAGYRWIAVRPGAAPPPRPTRRPLGPTPKYEFIPRWGLHDDFDVAPTEQQIAASAGPSMRTVRRTVVTTMALLGAAAVIHLVNYALMLLNRSILLNPIVAAVATWAGVTVSVLALFAVIIALVILTNWLIARRAAAYLRYGETDPRSAFEIRCGCLIPLVNLLWAPVYVLDLARVEGRLSRLRGPIVIWWCAWVLSTVVSISSIATFRAQDPQGIANNTVTTIIAYLMALAALVLTVKVYDGFERVPRDRPATRWIIVPDDSPRERAESKPSDEREEQSSAPVESGRTEPAAQVS